LAKGSTALTAFNRGLISRFGAARIDLKRSAFSAEVQTNWVSRVLGSMMLRPGFQFLGGLLGAPRLVPFLFATSDTALIELTNLQMRVWVGDALINRPNVASAVTNGEFAASLAGWTTTAGCTWVNLGGVDGAAQILSDGTAIEEMYQTIAVAAADQGIEHAVKIIINRGPVTLRVGSAPAGDDLIAETTLFTGNHSLAFTPGPAFTIDLRSTLNRAIIVTSVEIEPAGAMRLNTPWFSSELTKVKFDQSADVIFLACPGHQQSRIERRGKRSWSIVSYQPEDGPFRPINVTPTTITPSALTGNITLTASAPVFRPAHIGALFKLTSEGQSVTSNLAAANTFSSTIEVTNVGEQRRFTIQIAGVWVGTVTLQQSIGTNAGPWSDISSWTANTSETYADELDNQIVFYRIGFKLAAYTSGTAAVTLNFALGSITGVARITAFTTNMLVDAEVLKVMGGTSATKFWYEGKWSDYRGWPSAVAFHEGRLWWAGKNGVVGSVSDAFDSFDAETIGDSGPIDRTIGSGPVDNINWLLSIQRLMLGAEGAEYTCKSTAFDEPLSPTNFNVKTSTTQGSGVVSAVQLDGRGIFVQRSLRRVYELTYDVAINDFSATDLTATVPDLALAGVVALAIQRAPETRIHCVLADGTVALGIIDHAENVLAWQVVETDGVIEDVAVLPGIEEDQVYYAVARPLGFSGVSQLTVTPGAGFTEVPTLRFSGGGGTNAAAVCYLQAVSATVVGAGSGFASGDLIQLESGAHSLAVILRVDSVGGAGDITAVSIVSSGRYTEYTPNPVPMLGVPTVTFNLSWGLNDFAAIVNAGGGYTSAPTVTIISNSGAGAAITATISRSDNVSHNLEKWAKETECEGGTLNKQADAFIEFSGTPSITAGGFVSGLSVLAGVGYATLPSLIFSGGGGSGAAGTVTLSLNGVIQLAALGNGYSKGDILTLVGGTYTRPAKFEVGEVFGTGLINGGLNCVLLDGGSYTVVPAAGSTATISCSGGTGSGARVFGLWGLGDATLQNGGSGYTDAPQVSLSGGTFITWGTPPVTAGSVTASITALLSFNPSTTQTITGLSHLEGKAVVVWGDGRDLSPTDPDTGIQQTYTVFGGAISLDTPVSSAIIGLPYQGLWKSTKLAYLADNGETSLCQLKQVKQVAFVLADTHSRGLQFGPDFDTLENLPDMQREGLVGYDWVYEAYDYEPQEFPSEWDADARLCLVGNAPRPVTVLGAVIVLQEKGKS
jgi:hypothetical protein